MADGVQQLVNNDLKGYIDSVEREEAEIKLLRESVKEIYDSAEGAGYEKKILKKVVAIRRRLREEGRTAMIEEEAKIDSYLHRAGDLPLFEHDADVHDINERRDPQEQGDIEQAVAEADDDRRDPD